MKEVEYFRWEMTIPGRRAMERPKWDMSAEEIEQRYPGRNAKPIIGTRVVRMIPENEEEALSKMTGATYRPYS